MTVYLRDPDITLLHGDVLDMLATMPDESIDCCITSPPYWGLRDYGTGEWDGGDDDCDHIRGNPRQSHERRTSTLDGGTDTIRVQEEALVYRDVCGKCGARRVDNQLGLEATPDLFVQRIVEVFRQVRRVLRPHGTCWVNLGDSYVAAGGGGESRMMELGRPTPEPYFKHAARGKGLQSGNTPPSRVGLPSKNLIGIPWRVAFALQADGWYLRSDIIWSKPNPMPESVTDRPTKAHEYVFLLAKQPRYFFDQEAVREPAEYGRREWRGDVHAVVGINGAKGSSSVGGKGDDPSAGRNVRSVWEIATQPYPGAHFATFPEELVRRCLLAGCPLWVCRVCGRPRERIVERVSLNRNELPRDHPEWRPSRYDNGKAGDPQSPGPGQRFQDATTLGWSDCGHDNYQPGVVLDPFVGSGTVAKVARDHQRHAIGIDLNAQYLAQAAKRLQQLSLLAETVA